MQELLLLLLLPVAAASGWWAARRAARPAAKDRAAGGNPVYFRGLNHLLNEEPDKAIDLFVQALEVDGDTVETHLALGNLFRRRGEVERAIRIHQNLIARPALTREQRGQALLELGQDYLRAGLFDRAENLFRELKDMRLHVRQALGNLRIIYQHEKDWLACLDVVDALRQYSGESLDGEKAHYFCELAQQARLAGRDAQAQAALKKALAADRNCVRATHLQAQIAAAQGDARQALRLLMQTREQDVEYLPEVLPEIVASHKVLGDLAGLRRFLEEVMNRCPDGEVAVCLTNLIREQEGELAAARYLAECLRKTPNLRGLKRLVDLVAQLPGDELPPMMAQVRSTLSEVVDERPQYQCCKCGFNARTLHWQCPSCRAWSTIKRRAECDEP